MLLLLEDVRGQNRNFKSGTDYAANQSAAGAPLVTELKRDDPLLDGHSYS